MQLFGVLLFPSSKKILKTLYFWEWNILLLALQNFRKRKRRNEKPKKFLIFPETELSSSSIFSKESFSYISENEPCTFQPKPSNKRTPPLKSLLYFMKLIFSKKKQYLIFFIRIFLRLNFFQNFFIGIVSINRFFFHLNFFQNFLIRIIRKNVYIVSNKSFN